MLLRNDGGAVLLRLREQARDRRKLTLVLRLTRGLESLGRCVAFDGLHFEIAHAKNRSRLVESFDVVRAKTLDRVLDLHPLVTRVALRRSEEFGPFGRLDLHLMGLRRATKPHAHVALEKFDL